MNLAPLTALGVALAAGLLTIGPLVDGGTDAALLQVRLDRPVGGGAGGSGAPSVAPAPGGLVGDVNAEDLLRIMRGLKYSAISVEKSKDGSSFIKAVIDDQPTYVWLQNCEGGRCRALLFAAYLGRQDSVDDAFIHDYNRSTLFTKMAKDKDGDLQITMGLSLVRGVSEDHIRTMAGAWVGYFREALEYKPEGR